MVEQRRVLTLLTSKFMSGDYHVSNYEDGARTDDWRRKERQQRMAHQRREAEERQRDASAEALARNGVGGE